MKNHLPPKTLWLLFDVSNGHFNVKNYVWWFTSRAKATRFHREMMARRRAGENVASLIGPYRYQVAEGKDLTVLNRRALRQQRVQSIMTNFWLRQTKEDRKRKK